jgi:hypothetical protein
MSLFPPSLRLKEPQAKPTFLIPPDRLKKISCQDLWRSHDHRALVKFLSEVSVTGTSMSVARLQAFFIRQGHTGRRYGGDCAATIAGNPKAIGKTTD